jgi:GTP 3',8-cyclase
VTRRDPIVDPHGRRINYVRLSVTDRCNFRCLYCMPDDGIDLLRRERMLTFEETEQLTRVLVQMGVDRIRLTGGEPTVRQGIVELVERIAAAKAFGLRDLAMTTNAWNLAKLAEPLQAAGLDRVNVSLDTLRPERFAELTRTKESRLAQVLAGLDEVVRLGWFPLKLNVVVCGGFNEDEVADFVDRFADVPVTIRYIEFMPFTDNRFGFVGWDATKARLEQRHRLVPTGPSNGSGPAAYWRVEGTRVEVGSIGALSHQFCESCNRIRITSDGQLKNCLAFDPDMVSLRDLMRGGGSDDELERAIRAAVARKPFAHECTEEGGKPFEGAMVAIGG